MELPTGDSTLTSPGTHLIDASQAEEYFNNVRAHFPRGFEDQIWWAGVHTIVNTYVSHCFMTDVDPKECAEKVLEKVGANDD